MTDVQPRTLNDHIELADSLIGHIAKFGYPGESVRALIDHAKSTKHPLPHAEEEIGIDELRGAYRTRYPHSVEWDEMRLTVQLLHAMGVKLVWSGTEDA